MTTFPPRTAGSDALTDAQLRATPVDVAGPLTDAELRATAVPVEGVVAVDGVVVVSDGGGTVSVDDGGGSLTVDGPLTDAQLRAAAVPVSGPLTDTQLRAAAVPVSGPLTDTQLRASSLPVSAATLPLPTGAATLAEQQTQTASLSVLDDWDESDRAKVNIIPAQAGVAAGAGVAGASTVRVVHASDQPVGTMGVSGRLFDPVNVVTATVKTKTGVITTATTTAVIAAVTGRKIRVLSYAFHIITGTQNTVQMFHGGTGTAIGIPWVLNATNFPAVCRSGGGPHHFYMESNDGLGIDVVTSSGDDVAYEITYVEVE